MLSRLIKSMTSEGGNPSSFFFQLPVIIVFVVLYGAFSSFYKIETGQQGVVTRFGAFSKITDEGPHFKLPFGIDQVYKIEVTRVHELQFGFRNRATLSKEITSLESLMLTGDLNVATVQWILQYKISDPAKYLFRAENVEKNIRDITISVMRRVVGDKLVSDVLTTDRVSIAENAKRLTQEALDRYDMGVLVLRMNLQNVTPPDPVKPAFNEINIAKQEKEQMINEAKSTYNKVIPKAEGQAEKKVTESQAYAVDVVNHALGDSEKFTKILLAYKKAPEIMRKRMYLDTMESVFSRIDDFVIVDQKIKGLLPVFQDLEKKVQVQKPQK